MPFRPTTSTIITISGTDCHFTEHPSAKGMPYGQTGRRATVYQVQNGQDLHALKVFTKAFRVPQIKTSARRIADFAHLPGLQVCARSVLTRQSDPTLIDQHPDLEFAVVMPWVQGLTWQEIMLARQPLSAEQSIEIARNFVSILAAMEEHGLAHCDLSGPNILLDDTVVNLVDVEDMYGPGLEQPEKLPSGSAGYAKKTAVQGLWSAQADRFAGAVLVAEMLGWCDERVRRIAIGEQYFDAAELQTPCDRYQMLLSALKTRHGAFADLFSQAWFSKRLEDCPSMKEWGALFVQVLPDAPEDDPALSGLALSLYESVQESLLAGNWQEAERQAQALKVLSPEFASVDALIKKAQAGAEQQAQGALIQEYAALQEEHGQILAQITDLQTRSDTITTRLAELAAALAQIKLESSKSVSALPAPGAVINSVKTGFVAPVGQTPGGHLTYCFGRYSSLYEQFPASLGMEFVKVPAGAFLMGSPQKENIFAELFLPDADSDEKPQHTVEISHDYHMARYPVTNAQYAEYCRAAGLEHPVKDWQKRLEHPVTRVSWQDAVQYIQWLAELITSPSLPAGLVLRLPTEAEWEKAARGADGRLYPWGNQRPDTSLCNFGNLEHWTTAVGKYSLKGDSAYGCADMSGNVWEWVNDRYDGSYYKNSPSSDPQGSADGIYRILRGGSWLDGDDKTLRSAFRNSLRPGTRRDYIGFRCTLSSW